jgi:hypothetical protein
MIETAVIADAAGIEELADITRAEREEALKQVRVLDLYRKKLSGKALSCRTAGDLSRQPP